MLSAREGPVFLAYKYPRSLPDQIHRIVARPARVHRRSATIDARRACRFTLRALRPGKYLVAGIPRVDRAVPGQRGATSTGALVHAATGATHGSGNTRQLRCRFLHSGSAGDRDRSTHSNAGRQSRTVDRCHAQIGTRPLRIRDLIAGRWLIIRSRQRKGRRAAGSHGFRIARFHRNAEQVPAAAHRRTASTTTEGYHQQRNA